MRTPLLSPAFSGCPGLAEVKVIGEIMGNCENNWWNIGKWWPIYDYSTAGNHSGESAGCFV